MQRRQTAFGFLVVLEPGDELIRSLIAFARQDDVDGAVCYGTGSVRELNLGVYDTVIHDYTRREFTESLEVCSLSGSIALLDGEPLPQFHGLFARNDFSVIGGRVFEAVCLSNLEVAIHTTTTPLVRDATDHRNFAGLKLELPA